MPPTRRFPSGRSGGWDENGQPYIDQGNGIREPTTLEQISQDALTQDAYGIISKSTGRMVAQIGDYESSLWSIDQNGRFQNFRNIDFDRLNERFISNAWEGGRLSWETVDPNTGSLSLSVDFTSLRGRDTQIWVRDTGGILPDYVQVKGYERYSGYGLQTYRDRGYRPATSEELVYRTALKEMFNHHSDRLYELAARGYERPDGTISNDVYEIAQLLAVAGDWTFDPYRAQSFNVNDV